MTDTDYIRTIRSARPDDEPDGTFTVYCAAGSEVFGTVASAHEWAVAMHARRGGTFECRDENFTHVFTVED